MLVAMSRYRRLPATLIGGSLLLSANLHANTLYGVTGTDLVTINPTTGAATVVGSLGMVGLQTPGPLAWNPTDNKLYGLIYGYTIQLVLGVPTAITTDQKFARINPANGAVTYLADFGSRLGGALTYDSIEYVDAYGSLVVSRSAIPASGSTLITRISNSGTLGTEVTTTLDNDMLAYDAGRSILYSLDPNGAGVHQKVDTGNGANTSLAGALPSATTGETAYDPASDRLYALDYTLGNKSLYPMDTADGLGPVVNGASVTISGDQVRGIAFTSVPEPAETVALSGLGLGLWAWMRRRSNPNRTS